MKLLLQFSTALISVLIITYLMPEDTKYSVSIPYFKRIYLNLSYFYILLAMVVIVGASNAVNLSDGLDGLASGLLIISFIFFLIMVYVERTILGPLLTRYYLVGISVLAIAALLDHHFKAS